MCILCVYITHTQNKFATPQLLFFFLVIKYSVVSVDDDDDDDDGKKIRSKQIKRTQKLTTDHHIVNRDTTIMNMRIRLLFCIFFFRQIDSGIEKTNTNICLIYCIIIQCMCGVCICDKT